MEIPSRQVLMWWTGFIGFAACVGLLVLGIIGMPELAIVVALLIFTFLAVRALFGLTSLTGRPHLVSRGQDSGTGE